MGMPTQLERMIWNTEIRARTGSYTFGTGLGSFKIPQGYQMIVWLVQIYPFFDMDNALMTDMDLGLKFSRAVHWVELSDQQNRQGLVHRSTGFPQTVPMGGGFAPAPNTSSEIVPVYWVFDNEFVVCRITTVPSPATTAPGVDSPPATEGQQILPYVSDVNSTMTGMGAGAAQWVPDKRRGALGNAMEVPRSQGSGATALNLMATVNEKQTPYTFPLVNINYVLVQTKEDIG